MQKHSYKINLYQESWILNEVDIVQDVNAKKPNKPLKWSQRGALMHVCKNAQLFNI